MIDIPDISHLTAKQGKFVEGILSGMGDVEAYRNAGYSSNVEPKYLTTKARELKNKGHIKVILTNFRLRNAEKMDLTAEGHTRQLLELAGKSEEAGQYGAAIRALELTGKVAGHYVDRVAVEAVPPVQEAVQVMLQEIESTLGEDAAREYARKKGLEWLPSRDSEVCELEVIEDASGSE